MRGKKNNPYYWTGGDEAVYYKARALLTDKSALLNTEGAGKIIRLLFTLILLLRYLVEVLDLLFSFTSPFKLSRG